MKFIRSFGYAWQGIQYCYRTQLNFRVQLTVLVIHCYCRIYAAY
jgi:diacylglycerol kinase